jgi:hypothetical protein
VLEPLGEEVAADHEHAAAELGEQRLDGREDAQPDAGPVGRVDVDRGDRNPADALHDADRLAHHDHQHDSQQDAGDDQHLLVGQLALEHERRHRDRQHGRATERHALEHHGQARVELQRL